MRVGFIVALLGALVLAAIGMIDLGSLNPAETAAPIVRAQHAPGAAQPIAAKPGPVIDDLDPPPIEPVKGGRLETLRLLKARNWDELTQRIEAGQRRVEESGRFEPELMWAVSAFDVGDPAITPLLDSWVAAKGTSYAPYLARAYHMSAIAWEKRGSSTSDKTTDDQRAGMRQYMQKAVDDARQALQPALADLRKACSLGEREACALAERVGG